MSGKKRYGFSTILLLICLVHCSSKPNVPEMLTVGKCDSNMREQGGRISDYELKVSALEPESENRSSRPNDTNCGKGTDFDCDCGPDVFGGRNCDKPKGCQGKRVEPNPDRNIRDVLPIVWKNKPSLNQAYKIRFQHEKRERSDVIAVYIEINEYGHVIFTQICRSTMNDPEFDKSILDSIKRWEFGRSRISGNVYELSYTFVFSQQ